MPATTKEREAAHAEVRRTWNELQAAYRAVLSDRGLAFKPRSLGVPLRVRGGDAQRMSKDAAKAARQAVKEKETAFRAATKRHKALAR